MIGKKLDFSILPVDSIYLDVLRDNLGVPENEAAMFVYQAGLKYLENVVLRDAPKLRMDLAVESINRQLEHLELSKYHWTGSKEELTALIPSTTPAELEMLSLKPD